MHSVSCAQDQYPPTCCSFFSGAKSELMEAESGDHGWGFSLPAAQQDQDNRINRKLGVSPRWSEHLSGDLT